jgi:hypothetical protein
MLLTTFHPKKKQYKDKLNTKVINAKDVVLAI